MVANGAVQSPVLNRTTTVVQEETVMSTKAKQSMSVKDVKVTRTGTVLQKWDAYLAADQAVGMCRSAYISVMMTTLRRLYRKFGIAGLKVFCNAKSGQLWAGAPERLQQSHSTVNSILYWGFENGLRWSNIGAWEKARREAAPETKDARGSTKRKPRTSKGEQSKTTPKAEVVKDDNRSLVDRAIGNAFALFDRSGTESLAVEQWSKEMAKNIASTAKAVVDVQKNS